MYTCQLSSQDTSMVACGLHVGVNAAQ